MIRAFFLAGLALWLGSFMLIHPASAQGYGEQRPLQFKLTNQDTYTRLTTEMNRRSVLASAIAARSSGSTSISGTSQLQSSSQLNNAVQITNNSTINVTLSGTGNALTIGDTINADQTSSGTHQGSTNLSGSNLNNKTGGTGDGSAVTTLSTAKTYMNLD